ncbi:MAG: succinate dehydrogenase flavoprotein subunit [Chloroflexota bacterium]|nr:succinate dehydrogenase flavoprotein subunit [Chloroflexota bacterium]
MASPNVIVVGGGLAGLSAAIKIAEEGVPVDLFSIVPVRRSHSVCAQGGINAAVNTKGEGDSPALHFDDTVYGGDFLANQTPVKGMCEAGPDIIYLLDRMGVPFNRTPEGNVDFRGFGGTLFHRTAFAGATTGQQLLYALDEQVRRYEAEGLVRKYEGWEFLSAIVGPDGICRGIVAQEMRSMDIHAFTAGSTILATGGCGIIFGQSTNSVINTATAASAVYQQGAIYANGEMIQVHPTAIPGEDKLRLISESVRADGGRVWVYKDGQPWYFLEDWYPKYGNLVPRDIATRAIFKVCTELGLGIDGKNQVYLDVSHLDPRYLETRLGGVLDIYEKFKGVDPKKVPMQVFPAMHYSMGGLWVDFDQMTNVPGLLAAGEVDYQYHGANRLGANSLLSCIYAGLYLAGPKSVKFAKENQADSSAAAEEELKRQREIYQRVLAMKGPENPYKLHQELGAVMTNNVTVIRENDRLQQTDKKILELMDRYKNVGLPDSSPWANQSVFFTRQLWNMLVLARPITLGALLRDESRGSHYKPAFPERNDEKFLKTTIAKHSDEGPQFSWEEVDIQYIKPRPRRYDIDTGAAAAAEASSTGEGQALKPSGKVAAAVAGGEDGRGKES